ncbi:hypothetical protein C8J56DRAFT_1157668 [Mycena floridula]|nr:hypothetical protein C8J56DRAFT_1157668 [Mycena floridula]
MDFVPIFQKAATDCLLGRVPMVLPSPTTNRWIEARQYPGSKALYVAMGRWALEGYFADILAPRVRFSPHPIWESLLAVILGTDFLSRLFSIHYRDDPFDPSSFVPERRVEKLLSAIGIAHVELGPVFMLEWAVKTFTVMANGLVDAYFQHRNKRKQKVQDAPERPAKRNRNSYRCPSFSPEIPQQHFQSTQEIPQSSRPFLLSPKAARHTSRSFVSPFSPPRGILQDGSSTDIPRPSTSPVAVLSTPSRADDSPRIPKEDRIISSATSTEPVGMLESLAGALCNAATGVMSQACDFVFTFTVSRHASETSSLLSDLSISSVSSSSSFSSSGGDTDDEPYIISLSQGASRRSTNAPSQPVGSIATDSKFATSTPFQQATSERDISRSPPECLRACSRQTSSGLLEL